MRSETSIPNFRIEETKPQDVSLILSFVKELAEYERLSQSVTVTEDDLREALFGERPVVSTVIGYFEDEPVSFALFFHNFSTFIGRPGLYLEDLYVRPHMRGRGFGRAMLVYLAQVARERRCGRMEWAVLNWNEPAIRFYKSLGARPLDDWIVFRLHEDALDKLAEES
ncbi:MAG TPA: GNAT family N-acetyltransferase [Pyrinomonadaceae bacterium]|jgi:GNAT superfamily N-acetyltransferase